MEYSLKKDLEKLPNDLLNDFVQHSNHLYLEKKEEQIRDIIINALQKYFCLQVSPDLTPKELATYLINNYFEVVQLDGFESFDVPNFINDELKNSVTFVTKAHFDLSKLILIDKKHDIAYTANGISKTHSF